ncbi:alpha/beta fold hydrolase [Caulobacter sp. S45]|uniref:alpha/beta fold hydrolase n=1 Tax=Caulobacter sp. S45 TaxID=1641861 RepID=UPI00157718B2|nr:alpha/beta hydrolase [Caulobacter sp. S45]
MAAQSIRLVTLTAAGSLKIAAHEAGPADGPIVLLVPGWPQTAYAWRRVQPILAEAGYRALALDLPGMGGSDLLAQGVAYDTGHVADLLASAVAGAGIARFALVGHDVGTWVAYAWATRHPQAVESLVLTEAAIPGVTADAALPLAAAPKVFQFYFNAVDDLPELLTQGRERAFLDWLFRSKTMVKDAIGEADLDHYVQNYSRPGRMAAGFAYYRALLHSIAQNKAAAAPSMPVLALGGEGGVGEALYTALKAKAPQTQGGAMAGVGHYIPEEAPDAFAERLLSFLAA